MYNAKDVEDYISLVTQQTGISRKYFDKALRENTIHNIINHPDILELPTKDRIKYDTFIQTANLYRKLKTVEDLNKNQFLNMHKVTEYLRTLSIKQDEREEFYLLMLNSRNELIAEKIVSVGVLDRTLASPATVIKETIRYDSRSVIIAHNHPSGNVTPSMADIELTEKLMSALELIDVRLLDSIVFSNTQSISILDVLKKLKGDSISIVNETTAQEYNAPEYNTPLTIEEIENQENIRMSNTYERDLIDKNILGQTALALERFAPDTTHMIVYDVLHGENAGDCIRKFLAEEEYENALESMERGEINILKHANVRNGDLIYDESQQEEQYDKPYDEDYEADY